VQADFNRIKGRQDLLNARYVMKPATATDPGPIYQDGDWKVWERKNAFPRAWLVHETAVEKDPQKLVDMLNSPSTDLRRVALVGSSFHTDFALQRAVDEEKIRIGSADQDQVDVTVHASGRALVVLSELFYPGWEATVNGKPAKIWKVDGALRGIVVPSGDSRVLMTYAPASVLWGAILTLSAFITGAAGAFWWIRRMDADDRTSAIIRSSGLAAGE
jgi:hypothetical protein